MSTYDAIKLQRLVELYEIAKELKFSSYPAHGSGFVLIVTGGNVDDLAKAIKNVESAS